MNEYNAIFEALQEKLNNGEITLEQAHECNDLAYDKYIESVLDVNFDELTPEDVLDMTESFFDDSIDEEETEITESEKELSPEEKEKIKKRKAELKEKRKKLLKNIAICAALYVAAEAICRAIKKGNNEIKDINEINSANKNLTKEIDNARKLGAEITRLEKQKDITEYELKHAKGTIESQQYRLQKAFENLDKITKKYKENGSTFKSYYAKSSDLKTKYKAFEDMTPDMTTKKGRETFSKRFHTKEDIKKVDPKLRDTLKRYVTDPAK